MDNQMNSPNISQGQDNHFPKKTSKKINSNDELGRLIDNDMGSIDKGFPLEVFPDAVQELIHNAKRTVGYNEDYFSAGILSVCATAIGNSIHLYNGTYKSKPIFWLSIIGTKGDGKTHLLNFAKKPIEQKDDQTYLEYKSELEGYEQKDKDARGKKPKYAKFILKDFTPEKLAESLEYNEKGILIFRDELMGWINSFDQYKKGGDQQMYLELFNGNELTVDRITKEPIRITETNVNILGGMQPEKVKQFANNGRDDDGFLERFLFVYPPNLKPHLFTGEDISEVHKDNYNRLIHTLLEAPPQTIKVNTSTIEIYKSWQHQKAKECFNDKVERALQAKMQTYVWRLALVVEMMQQAVTGNFNTDLKDESLDKAIRLVEYFRLNALKVHDKIMSRNPLDDLSAQQQELYKELPFEFKRSDVLPLFEQKDLSIRTADRLFKNEKLFDSYQTSKDLKAGNYRKKFKQ